MNCCGGNHNHQPDPNNQVTSKPGISFKSIIWLGLIGLMLVGIWQIGSGSEIKAAALLPFLGMLACPLMMGLMMLLGHNHSKKQGHPQHNHSQNS